ncbi:MAG: BlaI/MecI/CopY family transcriptional regulator [Chthoniobacteraceae bacterium]|jgi:BlaI family penicillinase repressor
MAAIPKISAAEWEVLNIVWDRGSATAPEVYEALSRRTGWHQKTVNTFLTRLAEKGVLAIRREGKTNLYSPKISRRQCVRRESESFLQRVFRGASGSLLAHFCEKADLTDEEVAQLQATLQQRSRKGRK